MSYYYCKNSQFDSSCDARLLITLDKEEHMLTSSDTTS